MRQWTISTLTFLLFGLYAVGQETVFRFSEFDGYQAGGGVLALAFDSKGERLAAAGKTGLISIRNVAGKSAVQDLRGHSKPVRSLAFSPDGRLLVSASEDESLRLWDLQAGTVKILSGHKGKVTTVAFSPSGDSIASAGEDKKVLLWSVATGQYNSAAIHQKAIIQVYFQSPALVVSTSEDRTVIQWNTQTRIAVGTIPEPAQYIHSAAGIPGSEWVFLGTEAMGLGVSAGVGTGQNRLGGINRRSELKLYRTETNKLDKNFDLGPNELTAMSVSADFNFAAVVHQAPTTSQMIVWDLKFGRQVGIPQPLTRDDIKSVSFSPDGRWLASGTDSGKVSLWKTEDIYPRASSVGGINRQKMTWLSERAPLLSFERPTTVAVLNLGPAGVEPTLATIASDLLRARLSGAVNVQLVDRERLDRVVAEQRLQSTGLVDPVTAIQIGKLVGADWLLMGTLSRLGNNLLLNIQIDNTTTGAIAGVRQVQCNDCSNADLTELLTFVQPGLVRGR